MDDYSIFFYYFLLYNIIIIEARQFFLIIIEEWIQSDVFDECRHRTNATIYTAIIKTNIIQTILKVPTNDKKRSQINDTKRLVLEYIENKLH